MSENIEFWLLPVVQGTSSNGSRMILLAKISRWDLFLMNKDENYSMVPGKNSESVIKF